jgi:RNA polymerase sigma factor (sigma-70 family)
VLCTRAEVYSPFNAYSPGPDLLAKWQTSWNVKSFKEQGIALESKGLDLNSAPQRDFDRLLRDAAIRFEGAPSKLVVWGSVSSDPAVDIVALEVTKIERSYGGFEFEGVGDPLLVNSDANAYRADVSVGMQDIFESMKGNVSLYGQDVEAGYSAPGMETLTDTNAYGGAFDIPLTESTKIRGKSDNIAQQDRIHASAQELNVAHQLNYHWNVSTGVRYDNREDDSPLILPTQELGDRTDAVVQLGYDPHNAPWSAYGFVQDTIEKSDTREDNNRYGMGGSYLVSERLKVNGEISDGDIGGIGGKLGTSYLQSERTNIYLNYVLEDAGSDAALDTLYERYGPRLLSFIRLKMGRGLRARLESRDILQATFLKSFQHLDDFEGQDGRALLGWLMRIAEHEIRDRADFHHRQQRDAAREEALGDRHDLAARSRSALTRLILDERAERLAAALASLTEAHRQVILLRAFEELSFPEIAGALGKSEDACRMQYARAMTALTLTLSRPSAS